MPASKTFSIGCYIGVGSRQESDAVHGASHFLEHVLFKGTARRSAEEISAAIESVGGDINAYTTKEYTCFYARVLDADAELAVDVLTDMLTSSEVLEREVDAERAVILDEIAMHADDPAETAQELVAGEMFGHEGLGRSVIGSVESITALSRDQIVAHWRRHYSPASVVVAAAGRVDHDRLVAQLMAFEEHPLEPVTESSDPAGSSGAAAGEPAGETGQRVPQRPAPARPRPRTGGVVLTSVKAMEQTTAVLALPSPGTFDDRRYPLGLLSVILGGGMSSRLFVEIRERRGLTYGIDADELAYSDAGQFTVEWQCAPDKLAEILRLVRATLTDVATSGVADDELERAKGQIRGQTVLSYEGPSSRMGRLGSSELMGDVRTVAELLERYEVVTAEAVQQEARELFATAPVLAVVGPRVPRRELKALLADWVTRSS